MLLPLLYKTISGYLSWVPSFQIHRFHAEAFGSILTRIDSAISLLSDQLKPMTCEIPLMNPSSNTSCSCSMSFMFYLWTY